MNKLISGVLLFVFSWLVFMWALSVTDEELLATVPAPKPRTVTPEPQAMAALARITDEAVPADRLVAPVQLPTPALRGGWAAVGESRGYDLRRNPQMPAMAQAVEVPGDFPLSEQHWRDAPPEDAGLEPTGADDPLLERREPPDDPWGGEWGDQGGGG